MKQSDTEGIAKATDEITKDYQNQANEIKTLSDKYEADLKFYNENKAKVADLTAQLTKAVQDAQKLGAKIDKKQEISGKSFEEIQKNLQDQITAMKALAEKQGKANTDYANASSDYATKSEEIKKLEAQLETLAKQGTDLGAKVSKGNVTDSKTLDEIKSLLTEQVKTISDLATKQKAINDKFDADTKAWNDGQAEAQKLTDELTADGKKGTVEIRVAFKDSSKVKDTTYYTVYKNVNTRKASFEEMKNYLKDDKLEVDNKARVDYKFKFDDEWNHSKESDAKVTIPVHSPKGVQTTKYVTKGDIDVTKLTDADKATNISSQLDAYNWIIEASLDKDAVNSGTYKSLSIIDKDFADLQSVKHVSLRTADNKDVTNLVDIQVWQDGKLYSVNGKAVDGTEAKAKDTKTTETKDTKATEVKDAKDVKDVKDVKDAKDVKDVKDVKDAKDAKATEAKDAKDIKAEKVEGTNEPKLVDNNSNNILLPEGLNTDGKKGNVQIKAVFKDATQVDQAKYYLALENVSYKDASEQEVANYKSGDKVVVDNVANAEYQGVFDDKAKETEDAKANLEQDAAKPVAPEQPKTPEQPKQTFAKTGVNDVAKYGFLAIAISALGFLGFRKFKGSKQD